MPKCIVFCSNVRFASCQIPVVLKLNKAILHRGISFPPFNDFMQIMHKECSNLIIHWTFELSCNRNLPEEWVRRKTIKKCSACVELN